MEDELKQELETDNMFPAEPEKMPSLTYWPFAAGFGMFFLLFGILTSWIVSLIGFLVMLIAFAGWIADINHDYGPGEEHRQED